MVKQVQGYAPAAHFGPQQAAGAACLGMCPLWPCRRHMMPETASWAVRTQNEQAVVVACRAGLTILAME